MTIPKIAEQPDEPRIFASPTAAPREPNCRPGDPVDARGLVHDWKHVSEDGPGDVYRCPVCGQVDYD